MSKTVDERVVSMQFDNKQFESNVKTTMGTLDKLKSALKLDGASKGLENVSASAKKMDFSPMSNGIEAVKLKFSALEVMAVTALTNITNSAVNAGKRLASAFTIDPIKTGFQEYETQINAVQTILANTSSKGTTLDQVNNALDELNTYADKTIYNFTEMTRNIGTFTAAGLDLDTSVSAIQGIANVAAVSGSTSQQASTAMYQLSQALSSGTVKLQDWNSVVNAGMGGQVFQDALKATARQMQETSDEYSFDVDALIEKNGSFRESLKEGWITADVLSETLKKFTVSGLNEYLAETTGLELDQISAMRDAAVASEDQSAAFKDMAKTLAETGKISEEDAYQLLNMATTAEDAATKVKTFSQLMDTLKEAAQSGWTQTWEILVGDFEEAKKLFTGISDYFGDVLNKSAEARNKMLQQWKDAGGRTMAIDSIKNAFEGLVNIITPIKEAFREVFPKTTSDQLLSMTQRVKELSERFKAFTEANGEKIKSTFKGIFSVIKIGTNIISSLIKGISKVVGYLLGFSGGLLDVTASLGEFISKLRGGVVESNAFGKIINTIVNGFKGLLEIIKNLGGPLLSELWTSFKAFVDKIIDGIVTIFSSLGEGIGDAKIESFLDILNKGLLSGILVGFNKFIKKFTESLTSGGGLFDKLKESLGNITDVLDAVRGSLQTWQTNLKVSIILKIAVAIAILAASIAVLSGIDKDKLDQALGVLTILFVELIATIRLLKAKSISGALKTIGILIAVSLSVLILASALKKLSSLNTEEIMKGLLGVSGLTAIVVAMCKSLSKKSGTIVKGATSIVILAAAINILASACVTLSALSWEELAKGLVAVGVLLTEIDIFLNTAKFSGAKAITTATGIVIIAAAIKILESSCQTFSQMSVEELTKGLTAIGVLLTEIAIFTRISSSATKLIATSIVLLMFAESLKLIIPVFTELSRLSWEGIAKGLTAIAGALLSITLASRYMSLLGTFSLMGAIATLHDLLQIFKEFEQISWNGIAKTVASIALTFFILSKAIEKISEAELSDMFGISMVLLSLGIAIKMLASIGIIGLGVALVAMAGGLTIIGVAAKKMQPLLGSLLKLSGSIAVFSLSLTMLGGSIAALGLGIGVFLTSLVAGFLEFKLLDLKDIGKGFLVVAASLIVFGIAAKVLRPLMGSILALSGSLLMLSLSCAGIGLSISLIAHGLVTLASVGEEGGKAIASALRETITVIADSIPLVVKRIGEGVVELIRALANGATELVNSLKTIFLAVLSALRETIPEIVRTTLDIVLSTLTALAEYTPQIIEKLFDILIAVIDGLAAKTPQIVHSIVELVRTFVEAVLTELGRFSASEILKAIEVIGIVSAIVFALGSIASMIPAAMVGALGVGVVLAEMAVIIAAFGALQQIPGLQWLIDEGGKLLQSIGEAIGKFIGGLAGGIISSISDSLPDMAKNLSQFMTDLQPFLIGAKNIDASSVEGAKALAEMILILTAAELIQKITAWLTGGHSIVNFAEQLEPFAKAIVKFSSIVAGNIDGDAVSSAANAGKIMAEMADTIPNSGGVWGLFAGNNDIDDFGKKLESFGTSITKFSKVVSGKVDTDAVTSAANAGKIMAEMADTIPNSGGVWGMFAGDNRMDDFGVQLVIFGKAITNFSKTVSGNVDTDAVTSAANAGKMMSEMANTIPNSGGVVSFFSGDNRMDNFGVQLVIFGEAIKDFSKTVSGNVDENAVKAAANSGKMMAEMANTIPNSGGVFSIFSGDNRLDDFGVQLVLFGKAITNFSTTVKNGKIDENAVKTAANAGKIMTELQNSLPKDNTLWEDWFGGGQQTLSDFGVELARFGSGIAEYYNNVKNIDDKQLGKMADETGKIVNIVKDMSGINEDGIKAFSNGISSLSEDFGSKLVSFGESIINFSDKVKGKIDEKSVEAAANAGTMMTEMASKMPKDDVLSKIFGKREDIATFGTKIELFGGSIVNFSNRVKDKIDDKSVKAAVDSGTMLVELSKAIYGGTDIITLLTGKDYKMDMFRDRMVDFATAIVNFSNKVTGEDGGSAINTDSVTAAYNAGDMMIKLSKALNDGGTDIVKFVTGEDIKMSTFRDRMIDFADAIINFSNKVKGNVDTDSVTAAYNAGDMMIKLSQTLNDGGTDIVKFVTGEDLRMDTFRDRMIDFATAIVNFSNRVKGNVDNDSVKAAYDAGDMMIKLSQALNDGGTDIVKFVTGEDYNMKLFSSRMTDFADAITTFSTAVKGNVDDKSVEAAYNAGDMMIKLSAALNDGGTDIVKFVTGKDVKMDVFKARMIEFAGAITEFSKAVSGKVKSEDVTPACDIGTKMVDLAKSINEAGVLAMFSSKNDGMKYFKEQIIEFGEAIVGYYGKVCGVTADGLTDTVQKTKELVDMMKDVNGLNSSSIKAFTEGLNTLGETSVDKFVSAFADSSDKVKNAVSTMLDNALNDTKGKEEEFKTAATALISKFEEGIKSESSKAKTAVETMAKECADKADDKKSDFTSAGKSLVEGFASGITANTFQAEAAARSMADAAYQAAKTELDINSPSKKFRAMATCVPEGFAAGIDKMSGLVKDSSVAMAQTALKSTENALSKVGNVVNGNLDVSPTIRPVLDMGTIDTAGLQLNTSMGVVLDKPVNSMAQIVSNAQNDISNSNNEVISAIKGLRDDLNKLYESGDKEIGFYVDGNKLGGALVNPINRQLNLLSRREGGL